MRTNGQIKIARPSRLPLKQWTVGRQSRKRKFPLWLCGFTGSELVSACAAPPPRALPGAAPGLCSRPPRPCAETPRLCSTPGSCKDSFPAREAGPRGPGSLWCVWVTPC